MVLIIGLAATAGAVTGNMFLLLCNFMSLLFMPDRGENGFFRIVRGGAYNPGTAYWAVPVITDAN